VNTSTEYFLVDALGSVVAITDDQGNLISQQRYLPFGAVRTNVTSPNSPNTDFGYTGQRNLDDDPSTGSGQRIGLMDYKFRFYSPSLGRFAQADMIVPNPYNPQAFNRFSYVVNSPINLNDLTGHAYCDFINSQNKEDCEGGLVNSQNSKSNGGKLIKPKDERDDGNSSGNNLDFTGYLADVLTARTQSPEFFLMQVSHHGFGFVRYFTLFAVECPGCKWDIKLKMGEVSRGIGLCNNNDKCSYYDYSTPGNIQLGYIAGLLNMNKEIVDAAGGLINTIDYYILKPPGATYGGCWTCDDPRDQAAVDFGYNLASNYPNGITRGELATELGNSPLTTSFQPPPSDWIQPYPASPGPTIYDSGHFDN
jgi:RHS repeat-associated protein